MRRWKRRTARSLDQTRSERRQDAPTEARRLCVFSFFALGQETKESETPVRRAPRPEADCEASGGLRVRSWAPCRRCCSLCVTKERKVPVLPSWISLCSSFRVFKPHEFAAVFRAAGRGSVGNNAPHHGEGHNLHQDLRRRAALSHQRRVTSEIFRDFRGHRRGGGDHGQADGKIQGIRLCKLSCGGTNTKLNTCRMTLF